MEQDILNQHHKIKSVITGAIVLGVLVIFALIYLASTSNRQRLRKSKGASTEREYSPDPIVNGYVAHLDSRQNFPVVQHNLPLASLIKFESDGFHVSCTDIVSYDMYYKDFKKFYVDWTKDANEANLKNLIEKAKQLTPSSGGKSVNVDGEDFNAHDIVDLYIHLSKKKQTPFVVLGARKSVPIIGDPLGDTFQTKSFNELIDMDTFSNEELSLHIDKLAFEILKKYGWWYLYDGWIPRYNNLTFEEATSDDEFRSNFIANIAHLRHFARSRYIQPQNTIIAEIDGHRKKFKADTVLDLYVRHSAYDEDTDCIWIADGEIATGSLDTNKIYVAVPAKGFDHKNNLQGNIMKLEELGRQLVDLPAIWDVANCIYLKIKHQSQDHDLKNTHNITQLFDIIESNINWLNKQAATMQVPSAANKINLTLEDGTRRDVIADNAIDAYVRLNTKWPPSETPCRIIVDKDYNVVTGVLQKGADYKVLSVGPHIDSKLPYLNEGKKLHLHLAVIQLAYQAIFVHR